MKLHSLSLYAITALLIDAGIASPVERRTSLPSTGGSKHLRPVLEKRQNSQEAGFSSGEPYDGKGKGAPFSGMPHFSLTTGVKSILTEPQVARTKLSIFRTQTTSVSNPRITESL